MNGRNVFAEDADKQHDHAEHEKHADEDGGDTDVESVPESQFQDQEHQGHQDAEQAGQEAGNGGQPNGDDGMADDPQHGQIVKRIEIILGDAALAPGLVEGDGLDRVAQFADQAAQKGIGVMDLSEMVQDQAVIQPEARGILDDGHLGNTVQHPVIELAQPVNQRIGPTHGLDRQHDLIALFPGGDELRDHLRGGL